MTKLKLTDTDFKEIEVLAELNKKIDQIDADYVNAVSDEIYKLQPFYLTVLLGYRLDVSMEELEEIMKIYFLVWEYFRSKPNIQQKQVTESLYSKIEKKNLEMLKYSEGELNDIDKQKLYAYDLQTLKSKALFTAVIYRFNERRLLSKLDIEIIGAIMIGIKSFIECFEEIVIG